MDESLRHFNPNPMLSANIFSKAFFCWLNPLFKKGKKEPLNKDDMFNVASDDSSENLGTKLEREWMKEVKKDGGRGKPSLLRALMRLFGTQYMLLGIIVFIEESVRVVQPLLLGGLIRYFTPSSDMPMSQAYLYATGVSLCAILIAITHHPYFFFVTRMGMQMRVACCSLMYKKALKLSNTALGETTTGQIVNLMSNDVNRFDQAVIFLHFLWIGPLQAIAVLIILWHELGPSVLAGFTVLLLLMPVQGTMGKLFSKLRRKTAIHTDERVKVMNEIIAGMRVIKMYCWEKPFGDLVKKLRRCELRYIMAKKRINAFTSSVWVVAHRVLTYALVVTHVLMESTLRATSLYIGVSFMFLMAYNGIGCVFEGVIRFVESTVSARRIEKFLLLDEVDRPSLSQEQPPSRPVIEDCYVEIRDLRAKWDENCETPTLDHVSASVRAGELLAVIGPVGSGKSSLLMAVLGELPPSSGSINIVGKVAYVSQQAWIFSGSIRQNIIFGSKYDKARFDKAVKASALHKDLEIMPLGDSTLIGDRGVSLSGGQRARVSLARALYTEADIYLLDDPLSAVDSVVGRHIFDRCILRELRKKPRILVTHQLQYLQSANAILILDEGKAVGMGTYEELSNSGIDFAALLKASEEEEEEVPATPLAHGLPAALEAGSHMSLISIGSDFEPEPVQLPEEEQRQEGTVGLKIYVEYFKAGSGIIKFIVLVLINLVAQGTYITSDWWLSRWSNDEEIRMAALKQHNYYLSLGYNETNVTVPYIDSHRNIYIFTGIIGGVFIFGMMRALLFFKIAVDASQQLHNNMFTRILRAPISFFDTNPVGRILNRFAKDVGHMDDLLPITFFDFVQCFLLIIGIILVAGFVNPWVFIPTLPLVILFMWIRRYYLYTSRSIKRLEGICRSPVFTYLSASLQGLHTIRAFTMEDKCQQEFDAHQDLHSEAWFLFLSISRWLAVRLDWLCALFVTSVTFCSVLASGSLDAGLVGLSITYSMTLMGMFQWGVRQSAEVENQMISVERVLEYSQLPTEAPLESDKKPPDNWPNAGTIEANDMNLRYFPNSPDVLKNLTFRIREKEKIGIVGRTGAGKSSLITCLFRLVEPRGQLLIDGVDVCSLGLHDLRKNISIIPQDPVLFTGTLRRNLDPFFQHRDDQLWTALEEVQLKSAIEELTAGLETQVSEGGVNFSVGQRQLICLARAILRHNRILLIDEATANVDPITDSLIQETIRSKFRYCTVLTIAHRLHTVMDSDRVMVLSDGCIVQFEEPHLLLQRESGLFYSMVQQTGKADSEYLSTIAADAYFMRRGIPRSTKEVEMPLSHTVSQEVATKVKSPNKVAVINNIKLDAPIAFAESFHSLLNHASREDDDEEEEVDNTAEERKSIDASEEASTVTSGQNNSAESESDTRNNSSVSDFSQVDDEFMNKGDLVKAGSNDDILENSGIEITEDVDDTSQCLLPKMESGIGTDVNEAVWTAKITGTASPMMLVKLW
ncbi:multidrug resistance-associated protein 4-like isoform X3 [Pomacea canaliculata]|uniref:multidrug resistance-associated protein 4-like isoform X3 n=1 Tax=Pomacea canaliculata TaxID=400727 RepID=UPI000D73D83D|nr:multidrug resistance-associated protein 4-like isoform X3 [Pomacea canaliculata]